MSSEWTNIDTSAAVYACFGIFARSSLLFTFCYLLLLFQFDVLMRSIVFTSFVGINRVYECSLFARRYSNVLCSVYYIRIPTFCAFNNNWIDFKPTFYRHFTACCLLHCYLLFQFYFFLSRFTSSQSFIIVIQHFWFLFIKFFSFLQ